MFSLRFDNENHSTSEKKKTATPEKNGCQTSKNQMKTSWIDSIKYFFFPIVMEKYAIVLRLLFVELKKLNRQERMNFCKINSQVSLKRPILWYVQTHEKVF